MSSQVPELLLPPLGPMAAVEPPAKLRKQLTFAEPPTTTTTKLPGVVRKRPQPSSSLSRPRTTMIGATRKEILALKFQADLVTDEDRLEDRTRSRSLVPRPPRSCSRQTGAIVYRDYDGGRNPYEPLVADDDNDAAEYHASGRRAGEPLNDSGTLESPRRRSSSATSPLRSESAIHDGAFGAMVMDPSGAVLDSPRHAASSSAPQSPKGANDGALSPALAPALAPAAPGTLRDQLPLVRALQHSRLAQSFVGLLDDDEREASNNGRLRQASPQPFQYARQQPQPRPPPGEKNAPRGLPTARLPPSQRSSPARRRARIRELSSFATLPRVDHPTVYRIAAKTAREAQEAQDPTLIHTPSRVLDQMRTHRRKTILLRNQSLLRQNNVVIGSRVSELVKAVMALRLPGEGTDADHTDTADLSRAERAAASGARKRSPIRGFMRPTHHIRSRNGTKPFSNTDDANSGDDGAARGGGNSGGRDVLTNEDRFRFHVADVVALHREYEQAKANYDFMACLTAGTPILLAGRVLTRDQVLSLCQSPTHTGPPGHTPSGFAPHRGHGSPGAGSEHDAAPASGSPITTAGMTLEGSVNLRGIDVPFVPLVRLLRSDVPEHHFASIMDRWSLRTEELKANHAVSFRETTDLSLIREVERVWVGVLQAFSTTRFRTIPEALLSPKLRQDSNGPGSAPPGEGPHRDAAGPYLVQTAPPHERGLTKAEFTAYIHSLATVLTKRDAEVLFDRHAVPGAYFLPQQQQQLHQQQLQLAQQTAATGLDSPPMLGSPTPPTTTKGTGQQQQQLQSSLGPLPPGSPRPRTRSIAIADTPQEVHLRVGNGGNSSSGASAAPPPTGVLSRTSSNVSLVSSEASGEAVSGGPPAATGPGTTEGKPAGSAGRGGARNGLRAGSRHSSFVNSPKRRKSFGDRRARPSGPSAIPKGIPASPGGQAAQFAPVPECPILTIEGFARTMLNRTSGPN